MQNNGVSLDAFLSRVSSKISLEESERSPRETAQAVLDRFFSSETTAKCSPCGEAATNLSTCTKIDTKTNPSISIDMVSQFITEDIEALIQETI
ncbi:hypothetical protein [Paracoccus aestuariivivens]|uniref:Uncharacterized protein n=1 Tax=Paracoccus aestuariivivens TaxID=1820333 RepID=A0A6L6JDD4_9RHOB|nr:hypothetical protein [Paracoccus aestuariivivens]MTH80132.1 hypothetical protein [Paracoccus aestuariivivens]